MQHLSLEPSQEENLACGDEDLCQGLGPGQLGGTDERPPVRRRSSQLNPTSGDGENSNTDVDYGDEGDEIDVEEDKNSDTNFNFGSIDEPDAFTRQMAIADVERIRIPFEGTSEAEDTVQTVNATEGDRPQGVGLEEPPERSSSPLGVVQLTVARPWLVEFEYDSDDTQYSDLSEDYGIPLPVKCRYCLNDVARGNIVAEHETKCADRDSADIHRGRMPHCLAVETDELQNGLATVQCLAYRAREHFVQRHEMEARHEICRPEVQVALGP